MHTNQTIFVVDDEMPVRESMKWLLESDGHNVITFGSAREFLNRITEESNIICSCDCINACLVLDLQMPDIGGLQLQKLLAQSCPCLPVIFISGHANEHQIEQAMNAGAVAFLNKPFNDETLLAHIWQALKY